MRQCGVQVGPSNGPGSLSFFSVSQDRPKQEPTIFGFDGRWTPLDQTSTSGKSVLPSTDFHRLCRSSCFSSQVNLIALLGYSLPKETSILEAHFQYLQFLQFITLQSEDINFQHHVWHYWHPSR